MYSAVLGAKLRQEVPKAREGIWGEPLQQDILQPGDAAGELKRAFSGPAGDEPWQAKRQSPACRSASG